MILSPSFADHKHRFGLFSSRALCPFGYSCQCKHDGRIFENTKQNPFSANSIALPQTKADEHVSHRRKFPTTPQDSAETVSGSKRKPTKRREVRQSQPEDDVVEEGGILPRSLSAALRSAISQPSAATVQPGDFVVNGSAASSTNPFAFDATACTAPSVSAIDALLAAVAASAPAGPVQPSEAEIARAVEAARKIEVVWPDGSLCFFALSCFRVLIRLSFAVQCRC